MEKINLTDLDRKKKIHTGYKANIYELVDGSILKLFSPFILDLYRVNSIKLEQKILEATPIANVPEIIVPEAAVYDANGFRGYISKKANGIDYNRYDKNLTLEDRQNLRLYADNHSRLESIVKRGNESAIVFPDLCSCDNIFIDKRGNMSLIDYDGLQVGSHITPIMSTSLGDQEQYLCPKYCQDKLFTTELDKKSLIILYFLTAFNIDLNKVGMINPITKEVVTLDFVFETLGLDDYDIQNKVWKCLQSKGENEFLGDDVYDIANYYEMIAIPLKNGQYIKHLIKK